MVQISYRAQTAWQNASAVEKERVVRDAEANINRAFSESGLEAFAVWRDWCTAGILQLEYLLDLVATTTRLSSNVGVVLFKHCAFGRQKLARSLLVTTAAPEAAHVAVEDVLLRQIVENSRLYCVRCLSRCCSAECIVASTFSLVFNRPDNTPISPINCLIRRAVFWHYSFGGRRFG